MVIVVKCLYIAYSHRTKRVSMIAFLQSDESSAALFSVICPELDGNLKRSLHRGGSIASKEGMTQMSRSYPG